MDGNNEDRSMRIYFIHCLVYLSLYAIIIVVTGCRPVIALNDWPIPSIYRPYLPPDEKDDVLLVCIYDTGHEVVADDAHIMRYPYDSPRLGMTGALGVVSVSWECTTFRSRYEILLFTKKHQIIYIPLRPYGAKDDALSYFYVADAPPIEADDFCFHKANNPCLYLNFISTPYYYSMEKIQKQQTLYRWTSIESAELAKEFWSATSNSRKQLLVASFWKFHSIFGTTGQVLRSRKLTLEDTESNTRYLLK